MNFTEEQLRGQYNLGFKQGYAKALDDVEKIIERFSRKYHQMFWDELMQEIAKEKK